MFIIGGVLWAHKMPTWVLQVIIKSHSSNSSHIKPLPPSKRITVVRLSQALQGTELSVGHLRFKLVSQEGGEPGHLPQPHHTEESQQS